MFGKMAVLITLILALVSPALSIDAPGQVEGIKTNTAPENKVVARTIMELFNLENVLEQGIETLPTGEKYLAGGSLVSPDGTKLAVSLGDRIVIVDRVRGIVRAKDLHDIAKTRPRIAQWDPNGEWIVFACGVEQEGTRKGYVGAYYSYNYVDDRLTLLKRFGDNYDGSIPALSPDEKLLAYPRIGIVDQLPTMWLVDLNTGSEVQVSEDGGMNPQWSHNGELLCYIKGPSHHMEPWIYDLHSRTNQKLYRRTSSLFPRFSPCDRFLCFVPETGRLIIASVDGKEIRELDLDIELKPGLSGGLYEPAWSPDGRRIAMRFLTCTAEGNEASSDIYTVNIDGSDLRRITFTPEINKKAPQWISDDMISFVN